MIELTGTGVDRLPRTTGVHSRGGAAAGAGHARQQTTAVKQ